MVPKLAQTLPDFCSEVAHTAAIFYIVFTGVSVIVYTFEMIDVCLTLKNDEENLCFARLAKSMVIACEEVPLPFILGIIFTNEPRTQACFLSVTFPRGVFAIKCREANWTDEVLFWDNKSIAESKQVYDKVYIRLKRTHTFQS